MICILFIPMFIAGLVMMKKSPDLLRKRLNAKEKQVLERRLDGYAEYKEQVRYKVIPFVW